MSSRIARARQRNPVSKNQKTKKQNKTKKTNTSELSKIKKQKEKCPRESETHWFPPSGIP